MELHVDSEIFKQDKDVDSVANYYNFNRSVTEGHSFSERFVSRQTN